jgi:5-methylcytosine-specific restriction endonuclease McrA
MKIRIDKADQLFSKWIRTRDNWTCQRCKKKYEEGNAGLHNSHFYGRSHESTRFEPSNCDALCFGCHHYFTANPNDYTQWKLKQLGQKQFDALIVQSNTYHKKDRKMEEIKWGLALKQS